MWTSWCVLGGYFYCSIGREVVKYELIQENKIKFYPEEKSRQNICLHLPLLCVLCFQEHKKTLNREKAMFPNKHSLAVLEYHWNATLVLNIVNVSGVESFGYQ